MSEGRGALVKMPRRNTTIETFIPGWKTFPNSCQCQEQLWIYILTVFAGHQLHKFIAACLTLSLAIATCGDPGISSSTSRELLHRNSFRECQLSSAQFLTDLGWVFNFFWEIGVCKWKFGHNSYRKELDVQWLRDNHKWYPRNTLASLLCVFDDDEYTWSCPFWIMMHWLSMH
jgi:hypothetical protein